MSGGTKDRLRAAVLVQFASQSRSTLGRTGMMKLAYLLQELRNVPLDYSFRLYTYGPYDSQVLEDLKSAIDSESVTAEAFRWQGGVGYEIKPGRQAERVLEEYSGEISPYARDIAWVLKEFGSRSASDLELLSTIIYVDRSFPSSGSESGLDRLISKVHEIKPHHPEERIGSVLSDLKAKGLLVSV